MGMITLQPGLWVSSAWVTTGGGTPIDAVGEYLAAIGEICFSDGSTGTKTLSAAGGGKIYWGTGSPNVFADAGTTARLGVQDVASGFGDGTFDVYGDMVGGSFTIGSNVDVSTPMTSGTKTFTAGDEVCVQLEIISRGGTDSVKPRYTSAAKGITNPPTTGYPYGVTNIGTPSRGFNALRVHIVFDDGTSGWIKGTTNGIDTAIFTNAIVGLTTDPDEYAASFRVPVRMAIDALMIPWSEQDVGESFEVILYADPFGTPTALATVTPSEYSVYPGSTPSAVSWFTCALTVLERDTDYAIAVRPTTASTGRYGYLDLTGFTEVEHEWAFLSATKVVERTDQTGAFTEIDSGYRPLVGFNMVQIDDGRGPGRAASLVGVM